MECAFTAAQGCNPFARHSVPGIRSTINLADPSPRPLAASLIIWILSLELGVDRFQAFSMPNRIQNGYLYP